MEPLNRLTKESILSDDILTEIFSEEDEIYKARLLLSLEDRAAELGVKKKFETMVTAYKRVERAIKQQQRQQARTPTMVNNWTNFDGVYDRMYCGSWIAGENGIFAQTSGSMDEVACYHPILPIERLRNLETGEEQIKLAYKRNKKWTEIIVPKVMITSASKIVALSSRGIAVTSENARLLVKYLADVENANENDIRVQYSTSKLGWIGQDFIPYDTNIIFDGDVKYKQVFESIGERGNRNRWFEYVSDLRRTGRMEIKIMLAASFASVLVGLLGGLPFFVDLWGETEGGKTVTLMLAASVWADPDESRYIGDYKTTDVGLEARADVLNHLPMILDDTSKKNRKIEENFEEIVYDLCSGKGKTRSNRDLGLNRENRWRNCVLTSGEKPLNSYVGQGGAINRILEVECGEKVYKDPQKTLAFLKKNYGFAGKEFIQAVKDLGVNKIQEIQAEMQSEIFDDKKMQKQSISLSIILTADKIATDYLFKDGQYISINDAKKVLIDRSELSDNERCYRFLLDKIAMNPSRFDLDTKIEKWGIVEDGYAILYNSAFEALCKENGSSKKSFLSWAEKKGYIQCQNGRQTKIKKINGSPVRCIFLKISDVPKENFERIDTEQIDLPFE